MFALKKKSAQPLYEQIKTGLRGAIEAGQFKPGDAIPDENVLARQLKVSHMTVRRALVELTREGLFKRVSGKGTFLRDSFAPQAKSRRGTIAIVSYVDPLIPAAQYYYRLLQGVMLGFEELGLPVVFRRATEPYEECVANLRQDPALCGVIAIWSDPALSRQLAKLSIPVVLLDCEKPDAPLFDSVNQDGESGVYQATKYLINLGHREIGMMQATQLNCIGQRRFDGYKRALAESGIPFQLELVYPVVFWCDAAYASMRRILQGPRIPTAVVCASDVLALGVLAAANEAGLRVPRDLSVVGFGDEGYFTVPQLSTARVPVEQMGLNATRMLAERLKRPSAPLQHVNFPSEWISRGTCDCPALAPAGKAPEHSR